VLNRQRQTIAFIGVINRNGFRRLRAQGGACTSYRRGKAAKGEATNYTNCHHALGSAPEKKA